jgi:hypothetical protein
MSRTPIPALEGTDDDSSGSWSDPGVLSAKVRELAEQSHRAVSARAASPPSERLERLRELRRQVHRLQRKVHKHRMLALSFYVDALGARIDDQLGRAPDRAGSVD